jgi:hypothetical protein
MNAIDRSRVQLASLLEARDYLLNRTPSDMMALAKITESIIDLNRHQLDLAGGAGMAPLPAAEQRALAAAVRALDAALARGAGPGAVIVAAEELLSIGRDTAMAKRIEPDPTMPESDRMAVEMVEPDHTMPSDENDGERRTQDVPV